MDALRDELAQLVRAVGHHLAWLERGGVSGVPRAGELPRPARRESEGPVLETAGATAGAVTAQAETAAGDGRDTRPAGGEAAIVMAQRGEAVAEAPPERGELAAAAPARHAEAPVAVSRPEQDRAGETPPAPQARGAIRDDDPPPWLDEGPPAWMDDGAPPIAEEPRAPSPALSSTTAARPGGAPPRAAVPPGRAAPGPQTPAAAAQGPQRAVARGPVSPYGDPFGPRGLTKIRNDIGDCQLCKLCERRNSIVFGTGNPEASLVFVGEGPGADEDRLSEPFVGAAGQLLDRMIVAMGLERREVYICNVVKCRPPGNRTPEPDEVAACEPFLKRQLAAIRPRLIVALGKSAGQALLKLNAPISSFRGRFHSYEGIPLMPTFHPAYVLRNPPARREVWDDLQKVMAEMDRLGLPRRKAPARRAGTE